MYGCFTSSHGQSHFDFRITLLIFQLKGLTDNLRSRDEVVGELQKQHEEQLNRLTTLAKDRETAWSKQKEEMEQHYAQLLSDLQSRSKVKKLSNRKVFFSYLFKLHRRGSRGVESWTCCLVLALGQRLDSHS